MSRALEWKLDAAKHAAGEARSNADKLRARANHIWRAYEHAMHHAQNYEDRAQELEAKRDHLKRKWSEMVAQEAKDMDERVAAVLQAINEDRDQTKYDSVRCFGGCEPKLRLEGNRITLEEPLFVCSESICAAKWCIGCARRHEEAHKANINAQLNERSGGNSNTKKIGFMCPCPGGECGRSVPIATKDRYAGMTAWPLYSRHGVTLWAPGAAGLSYQSRDSINKATELLTAMSCKLGVGAAGNAAANPLVID
tara:strand:+ start:27 stop:785 length:759 start_codon:yes stop_codon:yes gene_type:complete